MTCSWGAKPRLQWPFGVNASFHAALRGARRHRHNGNPGLLNGIPERLALSRT